MSLKSGPARVEREVAEKARWSREEAVLVETVRPLEIRRTIGVVAVRHPRVVEPPACDAIERGRGVEGEVDLDLIHAMRPRPAVEAVSLEHDPFTGDVLGDEVRGRSGYGCLDPFGIGSDVPRYDTHGARHARVEVSDRPRQPDRQRVAVCHDAGRRLCLSGEHHLSPDDSGEKRRDVRLEPRAEGAVDRVRDVCGCHWGSCREPGVLPESEGVGPAAVRDPRIARGQLGNDSPSFGKRLVGQIHEACARRLYDGRRPGNAGDCGIDGVDVLRRNRHPERAARVCLRPCRGSEADSSQERGRERPCHFRQTDVGRGTGSSRHSRSAWRRV